MTTNHNRSRRISRTVRRSDRGASLVEYAFLVALLALTCIVALRFMAGETSTRYSIVGNSVAAAGN